MKFIKTTLTLKVIASYLIFSAIAVFVCIYLYQKLNQETPNSTLVEKKVINTSAMISSLYEADSYASLALQSLKKKDFDTYLKKNDSIIKSINSLQDQKKLSYQNNQLDTVAGLLIEKQTNIEQLRLIKIATTIRKFVIYNSLRIPYFWFVD